VAENDKLTDKQRKWIDYFKQGLTAAEAAKRAGYRGNNLDVIGSQNLTKLSSYLTEREKVLDTSRIADMQEINEFWTRVVRGEEKEEQGIYNPTTCKTESVEVKPALRDRLKAAELRAKVQGAFIENINHMGSVEVCNPYDGLTLEQLEKMRTDGNS